MKNAIISFAALILVATSCSKEAEPCIGETVTCTHKVGQAFFACHILPDTTKWTFLNVAFSIDTVEMSTCDTSRWLSSTRIADKEDFQTETNETWKEFMIQFPSECGCK